MLYDAYYDMGSDKPFFLHWLQRSVLRSIGLKRNKYRVPDRGERLKSSLELQVLILYHKGLLTNCFAREAEN